MTSYLIGAYDFDGIRTALFADLTTYDEALAVHAALVEHNKTTGTYRDLVVRTAGDPDWPITARGINGNSPEWLIASRAQREYRRKELGRTVTSFLKRDSATSLTALRREVTRSLTDRGLPEPHRGTVERVIKDRITLGRCRNGCDRAWFWPRRHGSFWDQRCPACGGRLAQTSLAYGHEFYRLDTYEKVTA